MERKRVNGRVVERMKEETTGGILHWGRENGPDLEWFRDQIRQAYGGRAPKVLDPFAAGGVPHGTLGKPGLAAAPRHGLQDCDPNYRRQFFELISQGTSEDTRALKYLWPLHADNPFLAALTNPAT